jgi:riboflavin transporter FmnP
MGVVLAASSIVLISFGFNNLNRWGLGVAQPGAPFDLLGLSLAPVMIVIGIVLLQTFIYWSRRQQQAGRTPLLDLRVIASGQERAAILCMFAVVMLEAMLNFSVPLYIQIIQGRTPIETAIAMMPFNLTVFFTVVLVIRLYGTLAPRRIGQIGFVICTVALVWVAYVVRNDWSALPVMLGLITFGIGQGALVTLVFNVLVTAAPKELAGDVGSLRGTANNLAAGVGTAVAGALLVGLLSSIVFTQLASTDRLPVEVQNQLNLDNITFITNDRLLTIMERTTATLSEVEEAVRINTEARLRALKITLLIMACVALLAIGPASRLPAYRPGDIPDNPPPPGLISCALPRGRLRPSPKRSASPPRHGRACGPKGSTIPALRCVQGGRRLRTFDVQPGHPRLPAHAPLPTTLPGAIPRPDRSRATSAGRITSQRQWR